MTSTSKEFKIRPKEKIEKEVQKEMRKIDREVKKQEIKEEEKVALALKDQQKKVNEEVKKIASMSDQQKVDWILERHKAYCCTMSYAISGDILNGDSNLERYCLVMYLQELVDLFEIYKIEFNERMLQILFEKDEQELLSILNVLNYM